ncbi:SRPBCC family protein [Streptomyces sp. NPDC055078]
MTRRLRAVQLDFIESAPLRLTFTTEVSAPPDAVYRALAEDLPGWPDWFDAISEAVPTREGAGREIKLRIGFRFEETILAADPAERYAYRVDATNAPGPSALVEDWRIAPAGSGSRVRWIYALDGSAPARAVMRLLGPGLGVSFRASMRKLERRLAKSATL